MNKEANLGYKFFVKKHTNQNPKSNKKHNADSYNFFYIYPYSFKFTLSHLRADA